jgi:hypothetical protein
MSKKESQITLILALLMGFIGGNLSGKGETSISAVAQESPPPTPIITAEAITLTDPEGTPRIRLQIDRNGEPQLVFLSQEGEILTHLGIGTNSLPELQLNNRQGQPRIRLGLREAGVPYLDLLGDDPKMPAASLALTEAGTPELEFRDLNGAGSASLFFVDHNPRLSLREKEEKVDLALEAIADEPLLRIYNQKKLRLSLSPDQLLFSDQEGTSRLSLRVHQAGEPSISLKDKGGNRLASLSIQPLPKKEEPLLAMYDKKERIRAGLSLDEDGAPNLILRDKPLLSIVDKEGENGIYLSVEGEDRPNLYLSARQGERSAFLGLRKRGEMALDLMSEKEFPRASLFLNAVGEPALQLRDKDEKLRWSTPPLGASQ